MSSSQKYSAPCPTTIANRCNHLLPSNQYAPQSQLPEASVVTVMDEICIDETTCIIDLPFQKSGKWGTKLDLIDLKVYPVVLILNCSLVPGTFTSP